ncbi:hypothetical protein Pst134EA_000018 [Puccinia striiformis f. sp. tritici]|uniref:hypothetical protein n=1 Tax=Puccinia striiformis f. sp. tritici TaxID=168172 RepID=UPI0020088F6F|nr:hypothetical protein Pst134EA_000018 [Puccinia striiformis f. sp. tritici]KAH9472932.1 hypothetical protein Pst134EA_000018 [Puccinia striiformis f. sp. tritici]
MPNNWPFPSQMHVGKKLTQTLTPRQARFAKQSYLITGSMLGEEEHQLDSSMIGFFGQLSTNYDQVSVDFSLSAGGWEWMEDEGDLKEELVEVFISLVGGSMTGVVMRKIKKRL